MSVIFCAVALLTLRREHLIGRGWLFAGFGAMLALIILHLIPLPPAIWQNLPGRELLSDVDRIAELGSVWRPVTLTPMNAWHALLSLCAPLAILLFGVQLDRDHLFRLLPVLIGLGALSGLFGLLQVIGSPDGPLYLYRITNNGSAVGLFANRNHAAVLLACLFPLLAIFASTSQGAADRQRGQQLLAVAVGIVLVPLILVTGSRSGMLVAGFGLVMAAILYRKPAEGHAVRRGAPRVGFGAVPIIGGVIVSGLILLTIFFSRAESIDRLFVQSAAEDSRADFWAVGTSMFWNYFPVGSGAGSFVEAFQIAEPSRLLNATYVNRAHNDWLETAITFGLPGLLLLSASIGLYMRRTFIIWRYDNPDRRNIKFAKMAGAIMAMIAMASIGDYPLRTPIMMCVMAILVLWFNEPSRERYFSRSSNRTQAGQGMEP
jgi:O-antigen ligase